MFALTKKTDYALIALAHLATQPEGRICTAREIAERYHMPAALLVNVLKSLCQSELIQSTRGMRGGYALAVPADQITIAAIIEAIEGPVRFVQCSGDDAGREAPCELLALCPVSRPVRMVHDRLVAFLNQFTLDQIAFDERFPRQGVPLSVAGVSLAMESHE